jgi:MFS family permease
VYLTSYLRVYDPTITYNDTILIYACTIAGQACLMFLGGKLELRLGPRLAATLGSCLLVGAPLLSSGVTSLWAMTCTCGVLFGFGGGLTYCVPLVCGYRWEPKRKGLVSGVVLSGFGLSALVFNQVQSALVNPKNLKPDVEYKVRDSLSVYCK